MAKKNKTKKKSVGQDIAAEPESDVAESSEITGDEQPRTDYLWIGGSIAITVLSAFLRFFMLGLKPFHHDEGVNGFFLTTLFKDGIYKYDPANYHGPTLYYISLVFAKIFGLETVPVRMSTTIFGVLIVVLALYLKRYIGRIGALTAALFLALSPGMVFISRYFIHEIFFVFLSLAIVVSVLFFIEKRKADYGAMAWMALLLFISLIPSALKLADFIGGDNTGVLWTFRTAFLFGDAVLVYVILKKLLAWDEGRPIYLILAAASAALFFATKETAFITLGTMLIAGASVWIWVKLRSSAFFEKNWFMFLVGVHIGLIALALYNRTVLSDGAAWLHDNLIGGTRPPENFVYYSIIFMIIAGVTAWIMFLGELKRENVTNLSEPIAPNWQNFRKAAGANANFILIAATSATAFIYLSVLFFTSFFTYADGVNKAFEAYAIWTKTGNKDHTMHGYTGYLKWGMKIEAPILITAALGAFTALLKGKHRVAMFTALWAIGLFAAYSIIPYKTPWLALSFLLPMCIIAGYGVGELLESKNRNLRVAVGALAIVGTMVLAYQSYQHNFVRYDDEDMPYVYAHTKRGLHDMIREIDRYADKSGKGKEATIEIVSPDYWPMTWDLHDYSHANFHGSLVDANTAEIIVAKKNDQDAAMIQKYSPHYKYAGVYPLRPGVNLVLLVRNDLADAKDQDVIKVLEYKTIRGYTD